MDINWSEKNTAELELFFSTDSKKGMSREQYLNAKAQHGENIIDSEMLEQQNFYGLQKKKINIKAMLTEAVGITGILFLIVIIILKLIGVDVNVYIFLFFFLFLSALAFILSVSSEKKYEYLYKLARPKALVIRRNKRIKVFIEKIVPGDVLLLSSGDIVPADARIVFEDGFSCVRAEKNGAFTQMPKTAGIIKSAVRNPETPANIVCAADVVHSGSAIAIVTATGKNTRIAKKSEEISDVDIDADNDVNTDGGETRTESSAMQKYAGKLSRDFFLASIIFAMIIIISGIIQSRDIAAVILTCLAVSAAGFSEQIPVIIDFAVIYGMRRLAGFGILVKKTSAIDEINNIDTVVAKKNESFTQNKMTLIKISEREASAENASEIGYILSCMTMCANVSAHKNKNSGKTIYTGSAIDAAVFEALNKCGLDYDAISQTYQKMGKTIYNPENGIKSAVVLKDGKFNLICFGEAVNILERCSRRTDVMGRLSQFDKRGLDIFRERVADLYKEHDLVMAVASKDFNHRNAGNIRAVNAETESNLIFLGFACFSQPKTSAVFESIDYLKKSGINPVMIVDSDNAQSRSAAVKFGIVKNTAADILNDGKIKRMGDSLFYINAEKFRLFTPISLQNRIKFLQALKFRKKYPAVTINDVEEISLLNEPCAVFTSVGTETGILKNKASVITKNLTVSTILKTVRNAVLIYRNICRIFHFSSAMFTAQYLLIFLAVLLNGAYILSPVQIIWSGICAGFIFAVSLCFDEENKNWHILRKKIKEHRKKKIFIRTILKQGFIYGLLIFAFAAVSFFACMIIKNPGSVIDAIKSYINSGSNFEPDIANTIKSAQTAAFITYIFACMSTALYYMKGPRFLDFKMLKNKVFTIAFILNLSAVCAAVFVPQVRDFSGFGDIGAVIFAVSAAAGLFPVIIANFIREKIFFA